MLKDELGISASQLGLLLSAFFWTSGDWPLAIIVHAVSAAMRRASLCVAARAVRHSMLT